MKKNSIVLIIALVFLVALYFLISSSLKNNEENLVNENENLNEGTDLVEGDLVEGDLVEVRPEDEIVFCTMDAMECPDGSFVGRIAPNCEFAGCPIDEMPIFEEEAVAPEMIELIVE